MKLQKQLQQQLDKRLDAAENIAEHTRDWQLIRQFLSNRNTGIELSDKQQKKLDLYHFIYAQLASGKYTEREVINMLQNDPKFQLSKNWAYAELNATKELFGTTLSFNKIFEIRIQLDLNKLMMQKANEANDLRAFAMLEKNRKELLEMLPDHEEDAEPLQPHINEIHFNPELIGADPVDIKKLLDEINSRRKRKIDTSLFEDAILVTDEKKAAPL